MVMAINRDKAPNMLVALVLQMVVMAVLVAGQGDITRWTCPEVCESHHVCQPSPSESQCPPGSRWDPTGGPCGCCGSCIRYLGLNEMCNDETRPQRILLEDGSSLVKMCDPLSLECKKDAKVITRFTCQEKKGEAAKGACTDKTALIYQQYDVAVSGGFETNYFLFPDCDPDGSFSAVQKRISDVFLSRYFCSDRDGKRIFGGVFAEVEESEQINCKCSRAVSELQQANPLMHVTIACDYMGNFRQLQCQDDLCFCANGTAATITGPFVPKASMDQLPCYEKGVFPNGYFGGDFTCGGYKDRFARIIKFFRNHGIEVALPKMPCGYDHTYSPKFCSTDVCRCLDPDGTETKYSSAEGNVPGGEMDCNCARDQYLFKEFGITAQNLYCEGYGDYEPIQEADATVYCLNSDGLLCSSIYDDRDLKCCLPCNTRSSCGPELRPSCTDDLYDTNYCLLSQLSP